MKQAKGFPALHGPPLWKELTDSLLMNSGASIAPKKIGSRVLPDNFATTRHASMHHGTELILARTRGRFANPKSYSDKKIFGCTTLGETSKSSVTMRLHSAWCSQLRQALSLLSLRSSRILKDSCRHKNSAYRKHSHAQAHVPNPTAAAAPRYMASSSVWPPRPEPPSSAAAAPRAATKSPSPQASATNCRSSSANAQQSPRGGIPKAKSKTMSTRGGFP